MKKLIFFLMTFMAFTSYGQQNNANFDVSTMRIGNFKINMLEEEAIKIAGKPLQRPTEANSFNGATVVKYNNELVTVTISEGYTESTSNSSNFSINEIATKSSKFRTKSGMGVGSSKDELWNAYKDMNHIEILKPYDDNGNRKNNELNFIIYDDDAGVMLIFEMINNKVVSLKVSLVYEGC